MTLVTLVKKQYEDCCPLGNERERERDREVSEEKEWMMW